MLRSLILFFIIGVSTGYAAESNGDETIDLDGDLTDELVIEIFDAYAAVVGSRYTIESVKKAYFDYDEDYILLASLRTYPKYEVNIVAAISEEKPKYLYLSSKYSREVSCKSEDFKFNVDVANEYELAAVEPELVNHKQYTVFEKRKEGIVTRFTFNSYQSLILRNQVDKVQSEILQSMLGSCTELHTRNAEAGR